MADCWCTQSWYTTWTKEGTILQSQEGPQGARLSSTCSWSNTFVPLLGTKSTWKRKRKPEISNLWQRIRFVVLKLIHEFIKKKQGCFIRLQTSRRWFKQQQQTKTRLRLVFFNPFLGVWKLDETLLLVFDILHERLIAIVAIVFHAFKL